jgi:hypothetical protein
MVFLMLGCFTLLDAIDAAADDVDDGVMVCDCSFCEQPMLWRLLAVRARLGRGSRPRAVTSTDGLSIALGWILRQH